jgi:hypothetical protein
MYVCMYIYLYSGHVIYIHYMYVCLYVCMYAAYARAADELTSYLCIVCVCVCVHVHIYIYMAHLYQSSVLIYLLVCLKGSYTSTTAGAVGCGGAAAGSAAADAGG